MSDCTAWTPGNTLSFICGLLFVLWFVGAFDFIEEWVRKR